MENYNIYASDITYMAEPLDSIKNVSARDSQTVIDK